MVLSNFFFPWRLLNRRRANVLVTILFVGWGVGQLFLDRTWVTGLLFYIPSPVVLVCLLGAGAWNRRAESPHSSVAAIALLPTLFVVFVAENHLWRPHVRDPDSTLSTAATAADPVTLVHWNVASGRLGWRRVRDKLTSQRADIYVLSERPWDKDRIREWLTELKQAQSGVTFTAVPVGKMAVVAKGTIRDQRWLSQTAESQIFSFAWSHNGTSVKVFCVDLISDLDQHRDPLLRKVNDLIREHRPDIIVGDFNAPRRSRQLQRLPSGYRHAYNVAGQGLGYTWPVPIPLYALDQCIIGQRLQVSQYGLQTSFSDHRLQRLEFRAKPKHDGNGATVAPRARR